MNLDNFKLSTDYFDHNYACEQENSATYSYCRVKLQDPIRYFWVIRGEYHIKIAFENRYNSTDIVVSSFNINPSTINIVFIIKCILTEFSGRQLLVGENDLYICMLTVLEFYEKILKIKF